MATCLVTGTILDPAGSPLSGISVIFNTQTQAVAAEPVEGQTSTDTNGVWGLSLLQGLSGVFTVALPNSSTSRKVNYRFNVNIPAASSASFSSILVDS